MRDADLARFKRDDPHAVLGAVPGVYVRGEDGFGLRPNVGIRGVNPDRSKKVTLLEDGILFGPAPYSAPAAYYFPLVTRMSQVRVIKGPAAVSQGPQTVGGAVDFVTRPIPRTTTAGVDLAGGEHFYRKAHAHVGGSDGNLGFLIEGLHLGSDGFKELEGADSTGFHRNDFMVKAAYAFDPDAAVYNELRLKLGYSDEVSNETYLGLADEDFEDNPLQRYPVTRLDRMQNHRTAIVATHLFEPGDEVSLTTSVYRHDFDRVWRKVNRFRDADLFDVLTDLDDPRNQVYLELLRGTSDGATPQEALLIGPNDRAFVSQGVQSRLEWEAETGPLAHRLEHGVRLHYDRVERRHSEDAFVLVGGELFPEGSPTEVTAFNEAWSYALAAHATDALTWEALTVTPGLRFEAIRSGLLDRITAQEDTRWAHAILPGLGVYYALWPQLGVLAGVHRGFSPPAPGSDDDVDPELSWNYEAGVRYSDRPARAELIGFYNHYQNLTDVCTLSSGCTDRDLDLQFDAGKARIYGFEAYAEHAPGLGGELTLPISLAYTFTRAAFLRAFHSDDPIFDDVERNDEIPYVPAHQLSAAIGLEHPRAGGSLSTSYVAAMREQAGSEPLSEVIATDTQLAFDLALYFRPVPEIELYGLARNLLDSHAIVSRRPFGARPNAPRSIQIGIKGQLEATHKQE